MNRYVITENYNESVSKKFQFLDSVFLSLPLRDMASGKLLMDFHSFVSSQIDSGMSPAGLIRSFFGEGTDEETVIDSLSQIIKYVEREVVLFDAVEDSAFEKINNLNGPNSLFSVINGAVADGKSGEVIQAVKENGVRLVLTAHPTQFYPGAILGIINDLQNAIRENDLGVISNLLQQLSYTSFFSNKKPDPYDEALSLIWYLENVFFEAVQSIHETLREELPGTRGGLINPDFIELGFWPGGDRDGNPGVTSEITLRVAGALRKSILRKYIERTRLLRRRLTFRPVYDMLRRIESAFQEALQSDGTPALSFKELMEILDEIRATLIGDYGGIYLRELDGFIDIVRIFGYHFASLDIRQDRSVHHAALEEILAADGRYDEYCGLDLRGRSLLLAGLAPGRLAGGPSGLSEIFETIRSIAAIQKAGGEKACHRYIISNCSSASDVLELMAFFIYAGWDRKKITVDFVPLFETIADLENAAAVMEGLYMDPVYSEHLENRRKLQTVMLGFSDGTKDGGYFTANWSIYRARQKLTEVSRRHGINIIFFDGRGGPAARGGGKTHNFYASHGKSIENRKVHITIQGQTVSSNFGTVMSARYNIEQLLSAGLKNSLYDSYNADFLPESAAVMDRLSALSHEKYRKLRDNEKFVAYMLERTAMPYYGLANISSRPDSRRSGEAFSLRALRAIPFVASWTLNKQNIPGFYGLGHALRAMLDEGEEDKLKVLYSRSLFFRTLIENSMMVLKKTNFAVTGHLENDRDFGELWKELHGEFKKTMNSLLEVSGSGVLMEGNPKDRISIELREKIILPLCVIQQYALGRLKDSDCSENGGTQRDKYIRMVIRSSYGIINAGRNSV